MKKNLLPILQKSILSLVAVFFSALAYAQEETKKLDVDIDVNKGDDGGNFFMQPWVWVVGGAIFILLLVALMRGGGSKSNN